jgi:hypothetical protein
MNLKSLKKLKPIFSFYAMIISCGALGGLLLKFQFTLPHFVFLVPLFISSYVSFRDFWRFLGSIDKANSLEKSMPKYTLPDKTQ